jgi:hypothetical protein
MKAGGEKSSKEQRNGEVSCIKYLEVKISNYLVDKDKPLTHHPCRTVVNYNSVQTYYLSTSEQRLSPWDRRQ